VLVVATFLALTAPGWGHGDELRDQPPPVKADFVPPAPGTYTLQSIMRAPTGVVVDLDGRSRRLAEFTTGKITLLSFVYTRCSDAWGCPLAYRVFDAVGAAVERSPGLRSRVRLVTLSFDPRHDTPAVMRQYAGEQASRGVDWRFLTTRTERSLVPLLEGFGQDVRAEGRGGPAETGQLTHILKVFLIDPRGVVREIYSTAYLYPEVVLADIETLRLEFGPGEDAYR
jgi:cytochrome oxidase Cu insertion factor (SCO1/SenC/PrrC family)